MKPAALFLILGVSLSLIFSMGEVRGEDAALKSFTGLVIYFDDETIEVKKGKKEVTFYREAVAPRDKKEAPEGETDTPEKEKVDIALCQRVQIWYELKEGKRVVRKLRVISPGYCGP